MPLDRVKSDYPLESYEFMKLTSDGWKKEWLGTDRADVGFINAKFVVLWEPVTAFFQTDSTCNLGESLG